jgi:hypothetical protein
MSIELDFS